jgi:predicted PurR-regulated permease PerM
VTGAVQGILAAIVFAIVGLKACVVLGVLTFFMSMVPIVGATAVWLPTCIWLFLQGQTWQGVVVLIGGVALISLIDNFLKPLIMQGRIKVHPLLIFFSLFGGIKLFGPVGILFGPIITALLIAVIQIYREEYVKN